MFIDDVYQLRINFIPVLLFNVLLRALEKQRLVSSKVILDPAKFLNFVFSGFAINQQHLLTESPVRL